MNIAARPMGFNTPDILNLSFLELHSQGFILFGNIIDHPTLYKSKLIIEIIN